MRFAKYLSIALVGFAALWAGYWFIGSNGVQAGFDAWIKDRRDQGWVAEATDVKTRGFPNRFDTSFSDLLLADPETGVAWEAPFFQILALSYRSNHVIAVWPKEQVLATPFDRFSITSKDMRASLVLDANTDLSLNRSTFTANDLVITAQSDPEPASITMLRMGVERQAATTQTYRIGLAADAFAPAKAWRKVIDPSGKLPKHFDALGAELIIEFDQPWDRHAIEAARPQPRVIDLKLAEAKWGQLQVQFAGKLDVNESGVADGTITVKARNWRDILNIAVASGTVPKSLARSVEGALDLLSGLTGNPNSLDVPLKFRGGRIFLGPIPIATAPRIRLR